MDRKRGEAFRCDGKRLACVLSPSKDNPCIGCCYFVNGFSTCTHAVELGHCSSSLRKDGKEVIFVEVKDRRRNK